MSETQKKAPRRYLRWLEKETGAWRESGIISAEQAGRILGSYTAVREGDERAGKMITVLAVLGSVLLGVGVILFFAANWPVIPKWVKVTTIFAVILAAYMAGYRLAFEKKSYPRVGHVLIFLGSLFYGAGIWLVAQIFHINAHYPNGILFWAVGILPMAAAAASVPILVLASLLLTLWTVFEQTQFNSLNLLFLPLAFLTLALSCRQKSRPAAGFTLLGLVIWAAVACALSFRGDEAVLYIFLLAAAMGILFFVVGRLQAVRGFYPFMKAPFRLVGLLVFFLSLYVLTFSGLLRVLYYNQRSISLPVFFIAVFSIVTAAAMASGGLALAAGRWDLQQKSSLTLEAAMVFVSLTVLIFLAAFGPAAGRALFLLTTNLLFFLAVIAVVITGYLGREAALVNIGLVFFVLDVIARYFDFFWDMLNKSVFFMGGGLLLLAGGFLLERNRKKFLREMSVRSNEA